MPVSGEYTWSESDGCIEIAIPLKGVSAKKVDVFTASTILKVSYPPFLVDLNLHDEIDEDSSRAVLENGTLKIRLSKRKVGRWGRPQFEGKKEEINQRRRMALQERDERTQREMEKVSQKKVEEERMVFRKHMALGEKERQRLDDIKSTQKKDAEDAMHDAFLDCRMRVRSRCRKLRTPELRKLAFQDKIVRSRVVSMVIYRKRSMQGRIP